MCFEMKKTLQNKATNANSLGFKIALKQKSTAEQSEKYELANF